MQVRAVRCIRWLVAHIAGAGFDPTPVHVGFVVVVVAWKTGF